MRVNGCGRVPGLYKHVHTEGALCLREPGLWLAGPLCGTVPSFWSSPTGAGFGTALEVSGDHLSFGLFEVVLINVELANYIFPVELRTSGPEGPAEAFVPALSLYGRGGGGGDTGLPEGEGLAKEAVPPGGPGAQAGCSHPHARPHSAVQLSHGLSADPPRTPLSVRVCPAAGGRRPWAGQRAAQRTPCLCCPVGQPLAARSRREREMWPDTEKGGHTLLSCVRLDLSECKHS